MNRRQLPSGPPIMWNFGKLSAELADINDIAPSKATAFQSRLKNFHRLKFPIGFRQQMGKAALYEPGDIMMMALAIELTQLGLTPETVVRTLALNWYPTHMALAMAARSLWGENPDMRWRGKFNESVLAPDQRYRVEGFDQSALATPMFIFFDPVALASLMEGYADVYDPDTAPDDTFFYGGIGIVRDNIARWTAGNSCRLSLVNVSALLQRVVDEPFKDEAANLEYRCRFYRNVIDWTERFEGDLAGGKGDFLRNWIEICVPYYATSDDFDGDVKYIVTGLGMREDTVVSTLRKMQREARRVSSQA